MAVVERYYWQPTDVEEFVKLHREFHDKHLKKAGASDMFLWQDRSNWNVYIAEVWFENFAALDRWDAYFETEEAKEFGVRINAAATLIERVQYTRVDY